MASGIARFDDDPPSDWIGHPETVFLVHGSGGLLFQIAEDGSLVGNQRIYKGAGSADGSQLRRTRDGFYAIGKTGTRGWILHLRDVDDPVWERAYASTLPDGLGWFGIAEGSESLAVVGGNISGGLAQDSVIAFLEPTSGPGGLLSAGQVRSAGTMFEEDNFLLRLRGVAAGPASRVSSR